MTATQEVQVKESCNNFRDTLEDDLNDLYTIARAVGSTDEAEYMGCTLTYAASRIEKKLNQFYSKITKIMNNKGESNERSNQV